MRTLLLSAQLALALAHVVPGRVFPTYPQTWGMKQSTIAMVCNQTGPVDAAWGAQWGLTDLDWSGGMNVWAAPSPMIAEEFMVDNCNAINAASGGKTACWVYRNGVKVCHRARAATLHTPRDLRPSPEPPR